jgi:hypothetical protein
MIGPHFAVRIAASVIFDTSYISPLASSKIADVQDSLNLSCNLAVHRSSNSIGDGIITGTTAWLAHYANQGRTASVDLPE